MFDTNADGCRGLSAARQWLVASLLILAAAPSCAQEGECPAGALDCFPYRDSRVDLELSDQYETITLPPNATAEQLEDLERRIENTGIGTADRLGDERALVIQLPTEGVGATLERLNQTVAAFNGQYYEGQPNQAVTGRSPAGNPIFESEGANFVLINEIIVQFVAGSSEGERVELLRRYNAEIVEDHGAHNWYLVTFPRLTARDALGVSNTIHHERIVDFAQPGFLEIVPQDVTDGGAAVPQPICPASLPTGPVDPLFAQQWYLDNNGATGTQFADVNAVRAWQITGGTPSIVIAIIDDGVALNHPDFNQANFGNKFIASFDAFGLGPNANPNPWDGHGTAVAGIAAALTGNTQGIKGLGANIRMVAVRVYARASSDSSNATLPHAAIKAGIEWAADNAHVLNNSWARKSNPLENQAIESAIVYALSRGRVVVFAVGNDSLGKKVRYPATLAATMDIIAVGASDENDNWADFSNYAGSDVSLVAPGVKLITTDIPGSSADAGYCAGDYVVFSGTSASAPLVSAAAALVLSQSPSLLPLSPSLIPLAVRDRLESTAVDIGPTGDEPETGHGRLDACLALMGTNCDRSPPPPPQQTPSAPSNLRINLAATIAGIGLLTFIIIAIARWVGGDKDD